MTTLFIMRFDLRNPTFAGVDLADRYEAALAMAEWADQRGCLAVSLSEHHGSEDGYLPSPLVMAGAMAARTTTVAIAINALIAPFHDPLRLAEDPEAAWPVIGPYFMHESNAYGAWNPTAGPGSYRAVSDLDQLRAGGQYRILTPDEYAAELQAEGEVAVAKLHPMVGGIPPELAWQHLHLFEEAFL